MSKFVLTFQKERTIISPSSDLVSLGILPKQISEYTDDDIGSIIFIPYTDESGKIILYNDRHQPPPYLYGGEPPYQYNGSIEFEVVGVNHHKDINDESKPTITLMTRNIIRHATFDAREPNNPNFYRANGGNNRWSVSNIRQWLNSEDKANKWFTPQHEYDTAPGTTNINVGSEYVDEIKAAAYVEDPGFLAGFSDEIKQHFATVRNKTMLCNYDKELLSKNYEETEDKVFLPSWTEMGGDEKFIQEGIHLNQKFLDGWSRVKAEFSVMHLRWADGFYWLRTANPGRSSWVYVN